MAISPPTYNLLGLEAMAIKLKAMPIRLHLHGY